MEPEKKSGVFGVVLAFIVLLGLVVYYLSNKKDMSETPKETTYEAGDQQPTEPDTAVRTDAELETEVENLDTNFDDMNVEDLDM